MRAFLALLANLPWWLDLAILGGLAVFVIGLSYWFKWKFNRIVHDAVLEVGSPLKDARAEVHVVRAMPRPAGPSPYDHDEDDENYDPDLDGAAWDEPGTNFYGIDVTITPADPAARWDPTALALVPADYAPADATECSDRMCPLFSAEIEVNGGFRPCPEREVRGPHRLRMIYAVHEGLRAVKFSLFVTYFGRVELPAPLPKQPGPRPAGRA
jgi:hypothetical protein